jgi:predicted metalloprotease with PDZ domain
MRIRAIVFLLLALAASPAAAQPPAPIAYTVSIGAPSTHVADVEATFPTEGRASIDVMMAIWSPGFYKIEDYATRVQVVGARTPDGAPLAVEQPLKNHWRVETHGASSVVLSYRVTCNERSVTTNFVGDDYAVLSGAPTFITLADRTRRPHDVRLELPTGWAQSMTALDAAPDRAPNHYRAPDYDTLVDSPIVAGNPAVQEFDVAGTRHRVVAIGEVDGFDGVRAARDLQKIVDAHRRIWGGLPFQRYDFLLVFRPGGGGLEHGNSMLATTQAAATQTESGYLRWLNFISHEYCHAFNVKRLRPVELGPFDYEREPHTPSLWISEGFTSYFGSLAVLRSGLSTDERFLASTSSQIAQLQKSPGRLLQTLAASSLDVWTSESISGVNTNADTSVSYYLKGQIAGFLLDAKVRRATNGAKSLDDVMRLAYRRYGGDRGFTPDEFRATAEEVAGTDLKAWFTRTVSSTEELDYADALDWYGLSFVPGGWTLAARPDATAAQQDHLRALLQRY